MKLFIKQLIFTFFILVGLRSCSKETSEPNKVIDPTIVLTLEVSANSIEFEKEKSSYDITITTNVDNYTISSSSTSWIELSKTSGIKGSSVVKITALENTGEERTSTITISANKVSAVKITVTQKTGEAAYESLYPSYNTNPIPADATGMSSSATELAAKISLGWNVGNSLEASGSETSWGNPKITKELIDLVKQNGFNAIRIPCSWNQYLSNSSTAEIKTEWLERVKEVIEYCVDNDMYVLVNIHWDGGWLENNVTEAKQEENNYKQKAFWEQIATHFRDFDEHLLFAGTNEPNVDDSTQMDVLTSYHQTFIDAVRSTGGKNAYRTLVIQGPSTDIEKTNNLMTTLPIDTASNRMMVEVHYYTPWQFCGLEEDASWGKMAYYWGADYHSTTDPERNATWGEESELDAYFKLMKNQFVDNNIPVILGEFDATRRTTLTGDDLTLHLNSRAYFLKYVVKQAKVNGMLPFYWDNGGIGNLASGIFNRNDNTVFDTQALEALLEGLN
ncbi:cellulase family glycosylhydrolase [Lutibacter flavus]|uniref:Aryl-phospho-beta-D-glucosidase BglC, GH1 family n=1 Tax=Lutibacter flavus TaxID=691689 RepID=A0A238VA26_9FLAO|nr:cellulase family glycosylhydrolase [Lutibacter flavus]SNR31058.1 Aryl-phospho-beta-D-glucosidase BglC, GH1 family [Lutibacter flavus]